WDLTGGQGHAVFPPGGAEHAALRQNIRPSSTPALGSQGEVVSATGGTKVRWSAQELSVWDTPAGRKTVLAGHPAPVTALVLPANGDVLVSGDSQGNVCVWDVASGTLRGRLAGTGRALTALAVHPDGTLAALVDHERERPRQGGKVMRQKKR